MSSSSQCPEKVAVLGGGMAALTAAYELAKQTRPDGGPKYDITVYQQGWRLGGKGASGRSEDANQRIEEHGLHIWFGAYDNAFATMQDVYRRQAAKWPYGDLGQAFRQQCGFHLMEVCANKWRPWWFGLPTTTTLPGSCVAKKLMPKDMIRYLQGWSPDYFETSDLYRHYIQRFDSTQSERIEADDPPLTPDYLRQLATPMLDDVTPEKLRELSVAYQAFVAKLWRQLGPVLDARVPEDVAAGFDLCAWRHAADVLTVALAVVAGGLEQVLVSNDWDVINNRELRDWLKDYTRNDEVIDRSALVKASYSLFFSFSGGNTQNGGEIEAGTAVRAALWLLLNYKGAIMWRMNAGMGDTIFAPLYNILKAPPFNVKFKFFHRVVSLHLAPDKKISRIMVERQVTVKAGEDSYSPFVQDKLGIDCWPSRPRFDLLNEGVDLEQDWDAYNLESDWSTWHRGRQVPLEAGVDFDKVIAGIPIAALQDICNELALGPQGKQLLEMFEGVKTVQTEAYQVWLTKPLGDLGSDVDRPHVPPILTTFTEPIDTYADMSHLLVHEGWSAANPPEHLAYFCGVLEDEYSIVPPIKDPTFPSRQAGNVQRCANTMLAKDMRALWPKAYLGGVFDWGLVRCFFTRANIDKTERYTLALPATSRLRVKAGQSGFDNLFLAGDWIYNGIFVGCIEGAVVSGMQAARALSGVPIKIAGEDEWFKMP